MPVADIQEDVAALFDEQRPCLERLSVMCLHTSSVSCQGMSVFMGTGGGELQRRSGLEPQWVVWGQRSSCGREEH